MAKKSGDFLKDLNPFSFGLPGPIALLFILFCMSMIIGIVAVSLLNYNSLNVMLTYIIANGSLTGIIVIALPALITAIAIKLLKRYIDLKYIMFIALIGALSYAMFILLSAIVYVITRSYSAAGLMILLGDASIFGWWFFASKMLIGKTKTDFMTSLLHPTLNILLYIPYSSKIISFSTPFNILLIKLYAGIFIFLMVSYFIIFIVDRPYKKLFGFHSFDAFSQMLQNWLFDVNTGAPFGKKFGKSATIDTDTIIIKNNANKIKSIFFAPNIHYGPSGTIGGSDFPYMLEKHVNFVYNSPAFIMHCAVDMDSNPVSSTQYSRIKESLMHSVKRARKLDGENSYVQSKNGNSNVTRIMLGGFSLITLSRAPRITEDVEPSVALLFKEISEARFGSALIIDAHNSRFESAPKNELDGVKFNSIYANQYICAIKQIDKPKYSSKKLYFGASNIEIYNALGRPVDLWKGNMNIAIFGFGRFKHAILHINANNMLPKFRDDIRAHIKKRYHISSEIYTTDTHAVNSMAFEADNVVGRATSAKAIMPFIDKGISKAMSEMEAVSVHHYRDKIENFKIWGPNSMESIITIARSVYDLTRITIPIIVVAGFVLAAWVISVV